VQLLPLPLPLPLCAAPSPASYTRAGAALRCCRENAGKAAGGQGSRAGGARQALRDNVAA
jgi:hypothetical protein